MKQYLVFILIGLVAFSCRINAQILKPLPVDYSQNKVQQKTMEQPFILQQSIFHPDALPGYFPRQFSPACNFKYTLPKGAIFCRLEDAIYNRLNFWVKFRMGTDDRYSN